MKRKSTTLLLLLTGSLLWAQESQILFIGSSLSQGSGVVNPAKNALPAQLQALMGAKVAVGVITPDSETVVPDAKLVKGIAVDSPTHIYYEVGSQVALKGSKLKAKQQQKAVADFQRALVGRYPNVPITFLLPTDSIEPYSDYDSLVKISSREAKEQGIEVRTIKQLYPRREAFNTKENLPTSLGVSYIAWDLFVELKKRELNVDSLVINPASMAIPGSEYRSSGGFKEGADWHAVSEEISQILQQRKVEVLLLGNSITQGWGGSRTLLTHKPGKSAADKAFSAFTWESCGVSGDRTQQLLYRLEHGAYESSEPKLIVLTVGINNLSNNPSSVDCFEGIVAVVDKIQEKMPTAKVLLLGPLPAKELGDPMRVSVEGVHQLILEKSWGERVTYTNPSAWFTNESGALNKELYGRDQLHLSSKGYDKWAESLQPLIEGLIK